MPAGRDSLLSLAGRWWPGPAGYCCTVGQDDDLVVIADIFFYFEPTDVPPFKLKLLIVISSMTVLAYGSPGHAQRLENPGPSWLPEPAINPLPNWYEVRGGAWPVPAAVVEEMAAGLKVEAGSSRLDKYIVQYQGEASGNVRSIRLMGACDTQGAKEWEFSERFHVVFDGGKCYFDATYDPEEKRITYLTYHGR